MSEPELILIVDDSPMQRQLYAGLFKTQGYRVLTGNNGRDGVELALQHRPHLILMDVSMPEMDGPDAVQELRRYAEMADLPILALTGTLEPDDLDIVKHAGYSDWIQKGSRPALVLEKVQQWLAVRPQ